MYALRERRVHVTQEDFEMAVTKVGVSLNRSFSLLLCYQYTMKSVYSPVILSY